MYLFTKPLTNTRGRESRSLRGIGRFHYPTAEGSTTRVGGKHVPKTSKHLPFYTISIRRNYAFRRISAKFYLRMLAS